MIAKRAVEGAMKMKEYRMIRLRPALMDFIWGGSRLRDEFGKKSTGETIAESWELSVHRSGESLVTETGEKLSDYLKKRPGYLGAGREALDILIKFIDARDSLSLQVHPDEKYANEHENQHGKTEMWYLVDAEEGTSLIFGMKDQLTREQFRQAIEDNTIMEHVNRVPVHKGDYCLIKAGTLHAIGAGCLIAEIQQSSDVTYRVYDFGRVGKDGKPRQLHIDQAVDVTNLTPLAGSVENVNGRQTVMTDNGLFRVIYCPVRERTIITGQEESFTAIVFTEGTGRIRFRSQKLAYRKGDSYLVPAGKDDIVIEGKGECLLVTAG
ncbi:MAG: class I mannose-6-phosphate isomerase [Erysipelotrichaceae bacterium]|nr:class I mannose-6-phosphate isomerase [Erysipelotrichaceae bacterium]